jgi:DNA-binding IclR family transcriptional regulator
MPGNKMNRNTNQKSVSRGVQSIEVGSRLLYTLLREEEPMMLKDLAQISGFSPAQAHAYLASYRKIGLVEQNEASGRYRLGKFALDCSIAAMQTTDPMDLANDFVRDLSENTALNVALVVWGSFGPTVISVKESGRQLNMNTKTGTVYSMTGTASGRIFTAFLPEQIAKDAIAREKREVVGSGRVGQPCFMSKVALDTIREQGYSTVEDPPVPGISAYAAPVFDYTGQIVMAITIIGMDNYLEPRAKNEFIPALLDTTAKLSTELGYI